MKSKFTPIFSLAVAAIFSIFAFAPKADVYTVDASKSTITWEGKKPLGSHNGTVSLKSGSLGFNGKKLVQGSFVADMTTIKDADGSAKLEGHLKADDFFGVEKFPTATFAITKIAGNGTNVTVTGNLTIKGKTNAVSFPAVIKWNADKTVTATADKIIVDRTKFGVQYGSKSIFSNLGDKFINDEFTLSIKLVAKK